MAVCVFGSGFSGSVTWLLASAETALLACREIEDIISVAGSTARVATRQQEAGLPALTLAVLHERQLHQLVLHEGGSHQLRKQQHKSA